LDWRFRILHFGYGLSTGDYRPWIADSGFSILDMDSPLGIIALGLAFIALGLAISDSPFWVLAFAFWILGFAFWIGGFRFCILDSRFGF
jgi:hypothetical protein